MNKTRIIFIVSILVIAIVIIVINIMIHQSEKEIISTPQEKITEKQNINIPEKNTGGQQEETQQSPPRVIPPGEELVN